MQEDITEQKTVNSDLARLDRNDSDARGLKLVASAILIFFAVLFGLVALRKFITPDSYYGNQNYGGTKDVAYLAIISTIFVVLAVFINWRRSRIVNQSLSGPASSTNIPFGVAPSVSVGRKFVFTRPFSKIGTNFLGLGLVLGILTTIASLTEGSCNFPCFSFGVILFLLTVPAFAIGFLMVLLSIRSVKLSEKQSDVIAPKQYMTTVDSTKSAVGLFLMATGGLLLYSYFYISLRLAHALGIVLWSAVHGVEDVVFIIGAIIIFVGEYLSFGLRTNLAFAIRLIVRIVFIVFPAIFLLGVLSQLPNF